MLFPEPRRGVRARFALHREPADAQARAAGVRARLVAECPELRVGDALGLSSSHLRRLFELYDAAFFDELLQQRLREHGATLEFGFANRLRTSGGRTTKHRVADGSAPRYTIELGTTPLRNAFVSDAASVVVNGLPCGDRLAAVLRVFEHELVHLLELLEFDRSDCARDRFAYFAHRLFGHADQTHRLASPTEWARGAYALKTGSVVAFEHRGERRIGMLNRATERATVLVPANDGRMYSDGQRYRKFTVPLESLHRVAPDDSAQPRD